MSLEDFIAGFDGKDHLITDYLTDELLTSVGDDDRLRLLETSVLERMRGPLVDAVTGGDGGTAWLQRTAAGDQLVISLERSGTWFRYHHLLRDLLRLQAESEIGHRLAELHLAAARWHWHHADMHEAIEHYLAGGALTTAADLIADNAAKLLNGGRLQTVRGQLARLGGVAERHVGALVVGGWISFVTGGFAEAGRLLSEARRLDVDGTDEGLIVSLEVMLNLARGDVGSALAYAEGAVPPSEATQAMALGGVRVWAGRFDDARRLLELADELAASQPHDFVAAVSPIFAAVAEIESGDAVAAARRSGRALELATDRSMTEAPQMALAHSIVARTSSDPRIAVDAATRGVDLARRSPEYIMLAYALASAADVLLGHGHPEGAALAVEARSLVDRCPDPGIAGTYLTRVEARHGVAGNAPRTPELVEELTDRELAVLRLLPSQLSQREIASELFVSLNTVKTHCRAIYRKLGVGDRPGAIQRARDLHLR